MMRSAPRGRSAGLHRSTSDSKKPSASRRQMCTLWLALTRSVCFLLGRISQLGESFFCYSQLPLYLCRSRTIGAKSMALDNYTGSPAVHRVEYRVAKPESLNEEHREGIVCPGAWDARVPSQERSGVVRWCQTSSISNGYYSYAIGGWHWKDGPRRPVDCKMIGPNLSISR